MKVFLLGLVWGLLLTCFIVVLVNYFSNWDLIRSPKWWFMLQWKYKLGIFVSLTILKIYYKNK